MTRQETAGGRHGDTVDGSQGQEDAQGRSGAGQAPDGETEAPLSRRRQRQAAADPLGDLDLASYAHALSISEAIRDDVQAKYARGWREHGGEVWQKPGVLRMLREEVLDLAVYCYTLESQLLLRDPDLYAWLTQPPDEEDST